MAPNEEVDGKLCIAVHTHMWCIYVGIYIYEGNGCLGKQALEVARLFNDVETGFRFEVQREEHWIHTRPTWSIAVKVRSLELFCD